MKTTHSVPAPEHIARLVELTRLLSDSQLRHDADVKQYQVWLAESQQERARKEHELITYKFLTWLVTGLWILTGLAAIVLSKL